MKQIRKYIISAVIVVIGIGLYQINSRVIEQKVTNSVNTSQSQQLDTLKQELLEIEQSVPSEILKQETVAMLKSELVKLIEQKNIDLARDKFLEYKVLVQSIRSERLNSVSSTTTVTQVSETIKETTTTTTVESSHTQTETSQETTRVIDVPTIPAYRIIVNKKHALPASYAPGENPIAKQAYLKLKQDMQALGFAISNNYSGYRSYQYQAQLYNRYVQQDGRSAADKYSARPGHSEHQTGLVFDMIDTSGNLVGEGIADGSAQWLAKNAHRYGFVVRYQAGKEHITGYMAEPWHLRFIGNDATAVYQSGLTLEEYYGVTGGDYE